MNTSTSSTLPYAFPDDTLDAEKKDKVWIAQYGRAAFYHFTSSGRDIFHNARVRYQQQIEYCQGRQSIDRYKKKRNLQKAQGQDNNVNLDLRVLKVAVKPLNILSGILDRAGYEVKVKPVDVLSINERKQYEQRLKALMENMAFLQKIKVDTSRFGFEEGQVPTDEDGFNLHMNLNYKQAGAIKMGIKLQETLDANDYAKLAHELTYDCTTVGACIARDYAKGLSQGIERIKPSDFICGPTRYEDARDARYMGHITPMTMGELRKLCGKELTEDELKQIADRAARGITFTDPSYPGYRNSPMGMNYDHKTVDVLRFEFKSENMKVYKKNTNRFGNVSMRKRELDYQPTDAHNERVEDVETCLYEGYHIIATDYSFGCRKCYDIKYPQDSVGINPLFTYHVHMLSEPCVGEQIMTPIDFVMQNWLKLNKSIAQSIPKGYKYDVKALENIVMEKGAKPMSKQQVVDFHRETGNYLYSSLGIDPNNTTGASEGIQEMENGMSKDVGTYMQFMQEGFAMVDSIIGLNAASAANDPRPQVGKKNTEIAIEGTNNALYPYYYAKKSIYKSLTESLKIRIADTEQKKKAGDKDLYDRSYALLVENLPTAEEWQQVYAEAEQALSTKEITQYDMIAIRQANTLDEARLVLAYRQKKNQEVAAATQQANQKANLDAAVAAPQAAAQAQIASTTAEYDLKLRNETAMSKLRMMEQGQRLAGEKEIEALRVAGRAQDKNLEASTELITASLAHHTALEKMKTGGKD